MFQCESCLKNFTRPDALERHLKSCGIGGNDPVKAVLQCESCLENFTRPDNLERHLKSCGVDEVRFQCQLCPKKYGRKDHLKFHVMDKHADASTSLTLDHSTESTMELAN